MKNMNLPAICGAVNGKMYVNVPGSYNGETDPQESERLFFAQEAEDVVIDSRLAGKNSIFVAIKGEKADGHDFIEKVLDGGALGVICERLPEGYEKRESGAYILVEDCLKALRKLAAYYRQQLDITIVGIVGSVGKTSTKELVASVLEQDFSVLKTQGNFNNEIGVPLTIFKIRNEHEKAVVEMGISGFGEMDRLGEIVKPDIVVMTNIGPCHLENLKDLDGVLRAKSEVLRHIKNGGLLVINSDDEKLCLLKKLKENSAECINIIYDSDRYALEKIRIACYGSRGDVCYLEPKSLGVEGSTFTMCINRFDSFGYENTVEASSEPEAHKASADFLCEGSKALVKVNLQGIHQVMNSLAAGIVGIENGMEPEHIVKGIGAAVPMRGRCCPVRTDKFLVVDDSYNANPKSMMAGIDLMSESSGRKILVLGDMFELGTDEKELHYKVGEYAATKDIDLLVCVGELSRNMYDGYIKSSPEKSQKARYYKDRESLLSDIEKLELKEGDTILVKASHGMGFSVVVERLLELGTRYRMIKGREKMQIDDIMQLLSQTHWACNRKRETVEKSIENSLCFGMLDESGRQVAFGRTVTDYATMFYVSDVVVDKALHKQGLGRRFVEYIKSAEELKNLWGFLGTTKAKGFYAKCGFEQKDDFFMAMPKTNVNGIFNV